MAEKKTVLVVDDDQVFQELLADAITKEGYKLIQAFDGGAGIELALKHHPDFIVLDVRMPESEGIEVAKRIRKDDWGKEVPILMFTEVEDVEVISEALSQGVMWYEIKSNLTINEVVHRVNEALANK